VTNTSNDLPPIGAILDGPYWPERVRVVRVAPRGAGRCLIQAVTLDGQATLLTRILSDRDLERGTVYLEADVSALVEQWGVLKQSGETVRLLGPKERAGVPNLGLPDRTGRMASVIDVLHRAATLWESSGREGLTEGARGSEDQVRLVAQTLVNILPDKDAERRLLEGFLAGRDMLPEVPRQERLL
jgi:hypothetical protein